MTQPKAARWLDLIAYLLQHRFPVTREEIYAHVADYRADAESADRARRESLRRRFERDKDELRALGIQIESVPLPNADPDEAQTAYRLRARDFYLPYLACELGLAATGQSAPAPYGDLHRVTITRQDSVLLDRATRRLAEWRDFPLAHAAASARRKLEFDLPLPLKSVERILSKPLAGEAARSLEVLQKAVAQRTAVRCRYYSIGRDTQEQRVIEPYGLLFSWGRWYAIARARDRDAMRVFRADRMREAALVAGEEARFEIPVSFDVRAYVGRAPWELSNAAPVSARVRFSFPESRWVLAQGAGRPVEPLLEDGGAIVEFSVRDNNPFLRWLLTFRGHAELMSPETMAGELRALRQRVAAIYAGTT